jgi:crotonobetainyl-CoA:carnitine CoA-transferase CaiB-like acyl-CoA transferase
VSILEGTRVVELGVWVAGPGVGGVLADWGADVVKVEPPEGDPMRRVFALIAGHGQPQSPPFDLDNRGKRSVVLDLRDPAGLEAAHQLLDEADVFVTNLRPDAVERLGLGPAAVLDANPRLVYASVTGYGLRGPDADRASYDVGAFWARSGIASKLVPDGAPPSDIRSGLGDHVTAMTAVAGICAALLQRERTGVGQLVETSLLRTGIWCLGWDLGIQLRFGKMAPTVSRAEAMNPLVNPYRAADDRWFWLLGLETERHWPALLRAIGRADLDADERFSSGRGRRKNAAALIAVLDEVFASEERSHWEARFDDEGVWWAPVNTPAEVLEDPQVLATGGIVDVPEGGGAPSHRAIATPVRFSAADVGPQGPVPGLGEHTQAVLSELRSERKPFRTS